VVPLNPPTSPWLWAQAWIGCRLYPTGLYKQWSIEFDWPIEFRVGPATRSVVATRYKTTGVEQDMSGGILANLLSDLVINIEKLETHEVKHCDGLICV